MPMFRLFQLARAEAATPPKIGSSVLSLSCCSVGRDRLCHTENGREHLKDNPAVKNPEEQSYQSSEKRKQSLDRRLLECQDDPDNAGDEADEQVNPVEKFQHPRSCPETKGKIQQPFQHSPGFSHLHLLQPKDSEEEYRGQKMSLSDVARQRSRKRYRSREYRYSRRTSVLTPLFRASTRLAQVSLPQGAAIARNPEPDGHCFLKF